MPPSPQTHVACLFSIRGEACELDITIRLLLQLRQSRLLDAPDDRLASLASISRLQLRNSRHRARQSGSLCYSDSGFRPFRRRMSRSTWHNLVLQSYRMNTELYSQKHRRRPTSFLMDSSLHFNTSVKHSSHSRSSLSPSDSSSPCRRLCLNCHCCSELYLEPGLPRVLRAHRRLRRRGGGGQVSEHGQRSDEKAPTILATSYSHTSVKELDLTSSRRVRWIRRKGRMVSWGSLLLEGMLDNHGWTWIWVTPRRSSL